MDKKLMKHQNTTAHSHEGQRLFNERLAARSKPTPAPDVVSGPWLSNDAVNQLPPVRRDFDHNRDPSISLQMRDLNKTEAERRDEQSGRGSSMIKRDQPKLTLNPPRQIRTSVDSNRFQSNWLKEQRAAAMEQHQPQTPSTQDQPQITRGLGEPER